MPRALLHEEPNQAHHSTPLTYESAKHRSRSHPSPTLPTSTIPDNMASHPDMMKDLLTLYTRVAEAPTSLALFNFPPTSQPSETEIRTAFKHLALALHPDKAPSGREELHTSLFQKVHAAFEDLVDPPEPTIGKTQDAAGEGTTVGRNPRNVPRQIEDALHARVHDFREWLKAQRAAELEKRKGGKLRKEKDGKGLAARGNVLADEVDDARSPVNLRAREKFEKEERRRRDGRRKEEEEEEEEEEEARVSRGWHGPSGGSEGWEGERDTVVEGKGESLLAGANPCVARAAQVQREEKSRPGRFIEGAGSKIRAEKRLDRLHASRAISTREYERAWMALEEMSELEGEVQGFVEQEPELCEMLGIRTPHPESEQRLISNAVAAEELSEGVAANLGLLLIEVAPSRSRHQATRRGKKSQAVDSWEEEEDRLAASVSKA
ncbi:hypothetical protein KC347_g6990 [Hortaea werneckii]|nr:hypothetical protein KC347_g6990 [Hortaea werneckii]